MLTRTPLVSRRRRAVAWIPADEHHLPRQSFSLGVPASASFAFAPGQSGGRPGCSTPPPRSTSYEGLAVALALLNCGHTKGYAFAVTGLVGFVDPVAGLLGAYAVGLSQLVLAWALTFAPER
jgi:hypothetical protein